ncbi:MAG: hypothetical protein PVF43_01385 [Candidatus Eiseniibacteriota bacterium]|jgi:hypothetical protein
MLERLCVPQQRRGRFLIAVTGLVMALGAAPSRCAAADVGRGASAVDGGAAPSPARASAPDAASAPDSTAPVAGDTLDSPYGPAGYDASGEVEIWRMPALAREDTFGVRLRYEYRTIEIEADRLSLREILERAREGERRRREAVDDASYTENVRVSAIGSRIGRERNRIFEERTRVYYKAPDRHLRIRIAERAYGDQDEEEETESRSSVRVSVDDILDLASAPFYLENIDSYRYAIRDRQVFPDRVVYAVDFEPRSEFDVEPSGTFWIDAAEFVIIHEEMRFERNPAPLILKSLGNFTRERRRVDGRWMVTRAYAEAELRGTLLHGIRKIEFELRLSDFAFNTGLPDSLFAGAAAGSAGEDGVHAGDRRRDGDGGHEEPVEEEQEEQEEPEETR